MNTASARRLRGLSPRRLTTLLAVLACAVLFVLTLVLPLGAEAGAAAEASGLLVDPALARVEPAVTGSRGAAELLQSAYAPAARAAAPAVGGNAGRREAGPWASEAPSFGLRYGDHLSRHRLLSAFVLPDESLDLAVEGGRAGATYDAAVDAGTLAPAGAGRWSWRAPETPGTYAFAVRDAATGESLGLNLFVLVPYSGEATLRGYRIGSYASEPLGGNPRYERPRGFVEVTPENRDLWVSPHFRLSQFLCKQESAWPKMLALDAGLLVKLETLLAKVNERGIAADTFYVMSGFRTPAYNAAIGNKTTYSRHHYGDAADIYVDQDGDGWMDDIDGDGRIDLADAQLLHGIVEEVVRETGDTLEGGVGLYGGGRAFGPMVHVDGRGTRARWSGAG